MLPSIYVICLESKFDARGRVTIEYITKHVDKALYNKIEKFVAITPNDFDVENVASARQVAIIKGKRRRVVHADMSSRSQVACCLSHIALWKRCTETKQAMIIVEDDVMPPNMSQRIYEATNLKGNVVLFCCASTVKDTHTNKVSKFEGLGGYYITPHGATILLTHALPVTMHIDHYVSTCIATNDLEVYTVKNANDQWDLPESKLSTLGHSKSLFEIQVPRLEAITSILTCAITVVVFVLIILGFWSWYTFTFQKSLHGQQVHKVRREN